MKATHWDPKGQLKMVDVGAKADTSRAAIARGEVKLSKGAFQALKENRLEKGEALAVAKAAALLAAKKTAEWIPLCHALPLDSIRIDFYFTQDQTTLEIESEVRARAKTGVEMEALVSVSAAALTIYDMCKALDRSIVINHIRLVKKSGGKGVYLRAKEEAPR